MKQVHVLRGRAIVLDVPAPSISRDEVLVRVKASCISVGTEMSGIRASATPLWRRAIRQPEKVATVLAMASRQGVKKTWEAVKQKRDASTPTGYSAAGVVIEVGSNIKDIFPDDRVACAGGGYASHAELVRVPRNLCVVIPEPVDWDSASTVTLGAIAMQGVRRAAPTLGETFVVVGLGVLGQLTSLLLRVNGCRVIGTDISQPRVEKAMQLGADVGLTAGTSEEDSEKVARLTGGLGADGVIITASTPSSAVISTAFGMCRKKGRVVLVGDVGLNLNRSDFYEKEIDLFISTSYGPGRYDTRYEEEGLDYPAPYVRWTENRNMEEYLRLIGEQRIDIGELISARFPVSAATEAYAALDGSSGSRNLMVLLTYPDDEGSDARTIECRPIASSNSERLGVAIIGAGSFARSVHLPNLAGMRNVFDLRAVVARSGASARAASDEFQVATASTDFEGILLDPSIDVVFVVTRHDLHAGMALAALQAGKHVFVEKPLALTRDELSEFDKYYSSAPDEPKPILMTGYNRRFSPYALALREMLKGRMGPFMLNYRMNAGHISNDHWVQRPEGGGRNLGEACHIYDLFLFLAGAEPRSISAQSVKSDLASMNRTDNFSATVTFSDGSVASLMYTSLGSDEYSKETADLYVDGKVAVLDDYKSLQFFGTGRKTVRSSKQEKGHKEELREFAESVNTGRWPIPWREQLQSVQIALAVEEELKSGR